MDSFIDYLPFIMLAGFFVVALRFGFRLERWPTWIQMSVSCALILFSGVLAFDNGRGPLIAFSVLLAIVLFRWTWMYKKEQKLTQ